MTSSLFSPWMGLGGPCTRLVLKEDLQGTWALVALIQSLKIVWIGPSNSQVPLFWEDQFGFRQWNCKGTHPFPELSENMLHSVGKCSQGRQIKAILWGVRIEKTTPMLEIVCSWKGDAEILPWSSMIYEIIVTWMQKIPIEPGISIDSSEIPRVWWSQHTWVKIAGWATRKNFMGWIRMAMVKTLVNTKFRTIPHCDPKISKTYHIISPCGF